MKYFTSFLIGTEKIFLRSSSFPELLDCVLFTVSGYQLSIFTTTHAFCDGISSQQLAGFLKIEPRVPRQQVRRIAVPQIAKEIRFHRKGKKLRIHLGVVEAGHGTTVKSQGSRRKNEVTALQAAIAERGGLCELGRICKHVAKRGIVREQPGQLLLEPKIASDDRRHRSRHRFLNV